MTERIYYANQQVMIRPDSEGDGSFGAGDEIHGIQSVGMTTTFNLVQFFELGQLALYENAENLPDVEVTLSKNLDGYPLIWDYATMDATSPTLVGRSNAKCFFGMSIFDDTNDAAEGSPLSVVQCSGMYPSSLSYSFPLEDAFSEEITLVGNNKVWANAPTYGEDSLGPSVTDITVEGDGQFSSSSDDAPASDIGVGRRQHLQLTATEDYDRVQLPLEVIGVDTDTSGIILSDDDRARLSSITVSTDLGRDDLLELGRTAPYHRYVNFPVEVTCDIEVTSVSGDAVSATEGGIYTTNPGACSGLGNLKDRIIRIATCEGSRLFLGNKNKLTSVTYGGGDAGGGNATVTYSYSNFNDLTVLHSSGVNPIGSTWWTNRADYLQ